MTHSEFCKSILNWKQTTQDHGILMPNGGPIPEEFWAFFIGYNYSAYRKMKGGEADKREIKPYAAKLVRLLNEMPEGKFTKEIKSEIVRYVQQKSKK